MLIFTALHEYQIMHALSLLFDDLGHWVKRKSITWFLRFLLIEFDEDHFVENFQMTKPTLFNIIYKL